MEGLHKSVCQARLNISQLLLPVETSTRSRTPLWCLLPDYWTCRAKARPDYRVCTGFYSHLLIRILIISYSADRLLLYVVFSIIMSLEAVSPPYILIPHRQHYCCNDFYFCSLSLSLSGTVFTLVFYSRVPVITLQPLLPLPPYVLSSRATRDKVLSITCLSSGGVRASTLPATSLCALFSFWRGSIPPQRAIRDLQ
jgi:hypothetical protein